MKLNLLEKLAMNNPIRAAFHRHLEAPLLKDLGGSTQNLNVLEVGCGRGVGTELIFELFGAQQVHAFDLDPDMIKSAKKRLKKYIPDRLNLRIGDATAIPVADNTFDAVFDFAILHHVPNWQAAIVEIKRVLKPGGKFYFEEVTQHALNRWSYKIFFLHPTENRFSGTDFIAECNNQGLIVQDNWRERFFGDFIFGVARK